MNTISRRQGCLRTFTGRCLTGFLVSGQTTSHDSFRIPSQRITTLSLWGWLCDPGSIVGGNSSWLSVPMQTGGRFGVCGSAYSEKNHLIQNVETGPLFGATHERGAILQVLIPIGHSLGQPEETRWDCCHVSLSPTRMGLL